MADNEKTRVSGETQREPVAALPTTNLSEKQEPPQPSLHPAFYVVYVVSNHANLANKTDNLQAPGSVSVVVSFCSTNGFWTHSGSVSWSANSVISRANFLDRISYVICVSPLRSSLNHCAAIVLTTWHMAFACFMTQLLARTTTLLDGRKTVKMTGRVYLRAIVPIGFFFSLSLICGNKAYLYLSVAFIQMLKVRRTHVSELSNQG